MSRWLVFLASSVSLVFDFESISRNLLLFTRVLHQGDAISLVFLIQWLIFMTRNRDNFLEMQNLLILKDPGKDKYKYLI